jgi:signal transduction histidine kinase
MACEDTSQATYTAETVGGELDFKRLFEASPDILLVLLPDSPRFTIVAATDSRLAATMTTREQYGRGLFEVFPDNPDDPATSGSANLRASLARVMATRAADTMAVQKYDIRGPDGVFQAKYWSPRNIPVLAPSGEIRYILHRVEDVTELVRASEIGDELRGHLAGAEREVIHRSRELAQALTELRAANARLGELNAAKTHFFNNVSHEFRTPLTLMLGPLEQVLSDRFDPLTAAQRMRVEMVHANSLRLLKLVNALLDFARLESGRLRGRFAPVDIATATVEQVQMFGSAIAQSGLQLRVDCPRITEPVWLDRELWAQIVPNLVSNAFKFTLAGSIDVRLSEQPAGVRLDIADTGLGIPAAELPRIFDRFHRVEGAVGRTHEGTGIGLALVRELVELHGGRVSVQSELGVGTTFSIELSKGHAHLPAQDVSLHPLDAQPDRGEHAHATEAARWGVPDAPVQAMPGNANGERRRVLVVDDNPDLRAYIANLLEPAYAVEIAVDGLAALAAIRANPPDIVVSDVMMPRLDGLGLVRALRADARTATLPVILISARSGADATIEGLETGSDDYLSKPFTARELLARVRTHVELARVRQAQNDLLEARVAERTAELDASNQRLRVEVDERVRVEDRLRSALVQLGRQHQDLQDFVHIATHDLQEPLRKIRTFTDRLGHAAQHQLDDVGRGYLKRLDAGAERMNSLIEDLATISRITTQRQPFESTDLKLLVRSVLHELGARLVESDGQVEIGELPDIDADAAQLRLLFWHLLDNALKFHRPGVPARVSVTARSEGEHCEIAVADNGIGFDERYLKRIFTIFQRLHGSDYAGNGVGLAIVLKVALCHGGSVIASSRLGEGAEFRVRLPLRQ